MTFQFELLHSFMVQISPSIYFNIFTMINLLIDINQFGFSNKNENLQFFWNAIVKILENGQQLIHRDSNKTLRLAHN